MNVDERRNIKFGDLINRMCRTWFTHLVPSFRQIIWSSEGFYWFYKRWRGGVVNPNKDEFDYWVDGYPRSANTFLSHSFRIAFPEFKVRSHSHSPFLPLAALKRDIPGVVVIRQPQDAIVSYAVMTGHGLKNAVLFYIDFHKPLLASAEKIYVASFDRITHSAEAVVEDFCQHFLIDVPSTGDDLGAKALDSIDQAYSARTGKVNSSSVARPDAGRKARLSELKEQLANDPALVGYLKECESLFEELLRRSANAEWEWNGSDQS